MAVAPGSIESEGYDAERAIPRSPGVDYGLLDDFDPAKYDFYNLAACSVQEVPSGNLAEKYSQGNSEHHEVEGRLPSNHDEGSPEPLSPIEELDDDSQSLQSAQQNAPSEPLPITQNGSSRSESKKTDISGQIGLHETIRELSILEFHTNLLFSRQHLQTILGDRIFALKFIIFLQTHLSESVPILKYYLGAVNALKALRYARSTTDNLEAVPGHAFTSEINSATMAWVIEDKIARALDVLVHEDLPPFIANTFAERIDLVLREKMVGKHGPTSLAIPDGLAEAFVLSDPASPDNPIVFTSEGFHALTGYSRKDILGRNCRLLSGEKTSKLGRKRLQSSLNAERDYCEILLNYRKDGSPFMNMVMCVPLRDRSNKVRYYLGAQLDVTTFVNEFTGFRSVLEGPPVEENQLDEALSSGNANGDGSIVEDFTRLTQVFSTHELENLAERKMNEESSPELPSANKKGSLRASFPISPESMNEGGVLPTIGFYQNYLLVRPHPSLQVLFASSGLQSSGIVQKSILDCIGGSSRIRQELVRALEMGRKVTAKVRWTLPTSNPVDCWLHCTPLLGATESIGVWMIILVDMHSDDVMSRNSSRARHLVERKPYEDQHTAAADPTPWDKFPGRKGFSDEESQYPIFLKSKVDPAFRKGGQTLRRIAGDKKRIAVKDESLIEDRSTRSQKTLSHNGKSDSSGVRPLSADNNKSSVHKLSHSVLENARRSSEDRRLENPAPIKVPGQPASMKEDDTELLRPIRKKTYKSLSPYGIIFDD